MTRRVLPARGVPPQQHAAMNIENPLDELAERIAAKLAEHMPQAQPPAPPAAPTEYLTTKGAAKLLSCGTSTLEPWRSKGKGPNFVRIGSAIRYPRADLDAWIADHARKKR